MQDTRTSNDTNYSITGRQALNPPPRSSTPPLFLTPSLISTPKLIFQKEKVVLVGPGAGGGGSVKRVSAFQCAAKEVGGGVWHGVRLEGDLEGVELGQVDLDFGGVDASGCGGCGLEEEEVVVVVEVAVEWRFEGGALEAWFRVLTGITATSYSDFTADFESWGAQGCCVRVINYTGRMVNEISSSFLYIPTTPTSGFDRCMSFVVNGLPRTSRRDERFIVYYQGQSCVHRSRSDRRGEGDGLETVQLVIGGRSVALEWGY